MAKPFKRSVELFKHLAEFGKLSRVFEKLERMFKMLNRLFVLQQDPCCPNEPQDVKEVFTI